MLEWFDHDKITRTKPNRAGRPALQIHNRWSKNRKSEMAILPIQCGGYHVPSKLYQPHKPTTAQLRSYPPRIFISTKLVDVNPNHLRDLYSLCNHSCHQFPKLDEPLDILKLRTAIAHSSVVVSVFTDHPDSTGEWVRKLLPVSPENGQLVGFGRAVSDLSLTASIYDVMVRNCYLLSLFFSLMF